MSSPQIALIALIIVPVIMIMVLYANATLVFLSLCLGAVVTQFLAHDIEDFANLFFPQANLAPYEFKVGLVLAPALLTTLLMVRSVKGVRYWLNILPAAAVGGLVPLLVVPLLPSMAREPITHVALWQGLSRAQDLVVGGGALVSLLFLWVQRTRHAKEPSDKKSS
jgi:hypothetical protein